MNLNEYEQSLIKCQYMVTVCDQLLNQLETKVLSKILQRSKLISSELEKNELKKYDHIESEFKKLSAKMNQEYQQKAKFLDAQIKEQGHQIKKLKIQITLLQQSRYEGAKNNQLNIRKIKQVSQSQHESVQLKKLLNFQLQNLNSMQVSKIELNETIQIYEKKQIQLKLKIKKLMEKENQYFRCKDMEDKYEALILAKRKMVKQNAQFDSLKHQELFNKISAIAQANENIDEMNRYEKQLGLMIKEKQFIIEEIQKREELHKKDKIMENDSQDDTLIFQEEINNLRKTIANRKFQQRTKSIHASNKLESFLNDSTPKNSIHYLRNEEKDQKKKPKFESIFKIQIEPVSHLNQLSKPKKEDEKNLERPHRNSMPNQISKKPLDKSPQKHSQLQKDYMSENRIQNFDTIEIATLEKIIKDKESRMKQAMQRTPIPFQLSGSPINQYKSVQVGPMVRFSHPNKKIMITEPVEFKYKSSQTNLNKKIDNLNPMVTPNSRFIEQIIESNSGQHIERLKNNVRIKTKKSQSEKYRHLEKIQNKRRMQQQKLIDSKSRQSKIGSSKTVQPTIEHTENPNPKQTPTKENNAKKIDLLFTSMYDNEFMEIDTRQNKSQQKSYKFKYKDRIQSLSYDQSSLDNVLEKINLLKKVKQENNQAQMSKQTKYKDSAELPGEKEKKGLKDKVKIFKLSSRRKYSNGTSFSRKGKAEVVEDFDSEQEKLILPKIEQQDESIKNTLQSITKVEQKS